MIRPRRVVRLVTAPVLGAILTSAVVSGALAAEPADLAPFVVLERSHAGDGWQREDYVRFARGKLAGELVTATADPSAQVALDDPFTAGTALRQFSHNAGAKPAGGPSGRVGTLAGTFFWKAYRLPSAGEGCAAFDGGQAGASVTFGYVCRKGELSAAAVATFLDDLDPIGLAAQGVVTASARVDPADDPPGVPGWPFRLARHQQADER